MPPDSLEQTTFAALISEGSLEVGDGYRAKNDELGGDGLIFLRAGHVTDSHVDFNGVERFRSELGQRVQSKLAKAGDAVVTTKGNSTGRTTFVTSSMPPFVYSPHLSYWRSKNPNRIDSGFLRYWSKGPEFTGQLAGMKASTDMAPYLSLIDQKRLRISLPSIEQQRALANVLGALDDRIENLRQTNATLEAIAAAMFKSWFVDFDGVAAEDMQESELGLIPRGWRVESLDGIADYLNGLALQKFPPESETEFLPIIKIAQLRAGNTDGADKASARLKPDYVVDDGDVLFSWSGTLEVEVWTGGRGALNQHLFKITSREVPKWFYYFATRLHLSDFRAIAAGKATTMGHIQRGHLTAAKVAVPCPAALAKFDAIMAPMFKQKINSSLQSRTLAELRDLLLPRLISGRLKVTP